MSDNRRMDLTCGNELAVVSDIRQERNEENVLITQFGPCDKCALDEEDQLTCPIQDCYIKSYEDGFIQPIKRYRDGWIVERWPFREIDLVSVDCEGELIRPCTPPKPSQSYPMIIQ